MRESARMEWGYHIAPEKARAQSAARAARRQGAIVAPASCETCRADRRLVAHHDDYSKPLDVRFLCHACHSQFHKRLPRPVIPGASA